MRRIEDRSLNYYDDPYPLSNREVRDLSHLELSPQEANYIIVNSIANDVTIPSDTLRTLRQIRDSEDGGDFVDLLRKFEND